MARTTDQNGNVTTVNRHPKNDMFRRTFVKDPARNNTFSVAILGLANKISTVVDATTSEGLAQGTGTVDTVRRFINSPLEAVESRIGRIDQTNLFGGASEQVNSAIAALDIRGRVGTQGFVLNESIQRVLSQAAIVENRVFKTTNIISRPGMSNIQDIIPFRCESAVLPGQTITTTERRILGPVMQVPTGVEYEPITLGFIITQKNLEEKKFFDDWISIIYNKNKGKVSYIDDCSASSILIVEYDAEGTLL